MSDVPIAPMTNSNVGFSRVVPIDVDTMSDDERELLAFGTADGEPRTSPLLRTIVRHPDIYRKWAPFANQLLRKGRLTPRDREFAVLRIAWLSRCAYQWGQHVEIGVSIGIEAEELEGLTIGPTFDGWTASERAIIAAADELHFDSVVSDSTWDALTNSYDAPEIIELLFLMGHYKMMAWVINSLKTSFEEGAGGFDAHLRFADEKDRQAVVERWMGPRSGLSGEQLPITDRES